VSRNADDLEPPFPTCELMGMSLAQTSARPLLDEMFGALARGRGGWIITANLDFLRRYARDDEARALYAAADLRVADGMPLVWAARLQGTPLPERIAGSELVSPIAERAEREGRSIYLLGGNPQSNLKTVELWRTRWPRLTIRGHSSPMVDSPPSAEQLARLRAEVSSTRPDVLLVGMGSPKQEQVIAALRPDLPATWMVGVGMSFSFVSGELSRAPAWMQKSGLEWCWRLAQEPRRLGRRYLVDDLPFAVQLFTTSLWRRVRRPHGRPAAPR
jgi:N-acetylglucosaminyldiphosphoundecaprenol N-acetyl-beta-D-mannosaminyltransferase